MWNSPKALCQLDLRPPGTTFAAFQCVGDIDMGCPGWTYETYEERHFVAEQTVTEATRRPTEALLGRRERDSAGAPGCGNVLAD